MNKTMMVNLLRILYLHNGFCTRMTVPFFAMEICFILVSVYIVEMDDEIVGHFQTCQP